MPEGMLEYSEDPLSDSTPTYVDVTSYVTGEVSWADGKTRDLDEPQAGGMSFRLRNKNREWEPEYSGALFDLKPLRRFRWSIDGTNEMVGYVVSARVTWPTGSRTWSEVEVECVDGFELLSLDLLGLLSPATAETALDVLMQDQPFALYALNEKFGTVATAEVGPDGTYKNTPTLGQEGIVVGDESTSVFFGANEGMEASLRDTNHFSDRDSFSIVAAVLPTEALSLDFGVATVFGASNVLGAIGTSVGKYTVNSDAVSGVFSTTTPTPGTTNVIHGTYGLGTLSIYVDGVLEDTSSGGGALPSTGASPVIRVGNYPDASTDDVRIQMVGFFEHTLSPERVAAHADAILNRGLPPQTAGERIAAVADSTLWSEANIDVGELMVHAVMEHGQSKLEEITAAVKAEMPDSVFFFDGDGNPVYRGWNYKDGLGPLATFGAGPGEHAIQALEPVYDDEMFSTVVVAHQSGPGEETQHTATDAATEAAYFPRVHSETGLILSEHHDAIAVAEAILERHRNPMQRFANVTLNSADAGRWAQIQDRQIGDMIRVKGLSPSGTPIDVVTTILGRSKTYTPLGGSEGLVTCTWNCARGFAAGDGFWRLGIDGWSELGEVTELA